jgi:hypothetical protein
MKLKLNIFGFTFNTKHLLVFGIIYVIIMCTTLCGCIDINTMLFTEEFTQYKKEPTTNQFQQNKYMNDQMHEFLQPLNEDPAPSIAQTTLLID